MPLIFAFNESILTMLSLSNTLLFSSSIWEFVASNLLSELLADDLAFGFSTVKYFGYFEKILGIALARNLRLISFRSSCFLPSHDSV